MAFSRQAIASGAGALVSTAPPAAGGKSARGPQVAGR